MKTTGFQRQSDNASNKRHSSIYEIIAIAYSNFFKRIKKKYSQSMRKGESIIAQPVLSPSLVLVMVSVHM